MRTESKHVQKPHNYNTVLSNNAQRSEKTNGITVPVGQNNSTNIDSFERNGNSQLSGQEAQRYESIYKRIENICKEQDIDIQLAKEFGLLEKISGVMTKAELVQLDDNKINALVAILSNSIGWGDGLGFGEKDVNDLTKLVKDIHEKIALEKTGGSKWGQTWHNIKKGVKSIFGGKNVENCQNENEVSTYYQEKYLNNIKNATPEEKIEIYQELLKEFYYDFNAQKTTEKQLQMIKAIENLAAEDRAVMVKVIEKSFIQDPNALALFGKTLDTNFESIVLTRDGFNNTVGKLSATLMSHTAYKHMSEDDINCSLSRNKERALSFTSENGSRIEDLKKRQANGEVLTTEEENLLLQAQCFETRYAGALTGISMNYNLTEYSKTDYMTRVSNDTVEIGIQEAVFRTVEEFINSNPDVVLMPKEKFTELMDEITDGYYSKVVNITNNPQNTSRTSEKTKIQEDNKISNTERKETGNQASDKKVAEKALSVEDNQQLNTNNNNFLEKRRLTTNPVKTNTSFNFETSELLINDTLTAQDNLKNVKTVAYQKLEQAAQKGVEAVEKVIEESNLSEFESVIFLLSMTNLESSVEKLAFDTFEKWNDSQKALYCNYIENNANKIKAGKMIKSISALKKVECNNYYVKSEFEELIKDKEEKFSSSNTHLSTQRSFC